MTIPTTHNVGDPGHDVDHNSIVAVLTAHAAEIATLMASVGMALTDNAIPITDQASWVIRINLPSGNRGTAPPQIAAYIGGVPIAGINAYGELFAGPAAPTRPGFLVTGVTGQTANLQNWSSAAGTILASIHADGSLTLQGLTAAGAISGASSVTAPAINGTTSVTSPLVTTGDPWHNITVFSNGATLNTGGFVKYKMKTDNSVRVSIRSLQLSSAGWVDGTTIIAAANGLPATYQPVDAQRFIITTSITKVVSGSYGMATIVVNNDGSFLLYGGAASARLDGSFNVDLDV